MTERTHLTLHLELDPHDGSLAGRVLNGDADRRFSGWIGLAAAIEDALPTRSDAAGADGPSTAPIPTRLEEQ